MNDKTIAIYLSDPFMIKLFKQLCDDLVNSIKLIIVEDKNDLHKYNIIITDNLTLEQIADNFNQSQKILCMGELRDISKINNIRYQISFIKIPFKFKDLEKRALNLFSSLDSDLKQIKQFKEFSYNSRSRTLERNKKTLRMTEKENEIFKLLLSYNENYVSKEKLLKEVWNYNRDIDTHTLETHIYSLRQKINKQLKLKDLIIYREKQGYLINKTFI